MVKAKATLHAPKMNKTEEAYAWYLYGLKQAGEILHYEFEAVTLALGGGARYTPDFLVVNKDGFVELHETKGFFREAAKVRIKVAAAKFPFIFILVRKNDSGGQRNWDFEEVTNG